MSLSVLGKLKSDLFSTIAQVIFLNLKTLNALLFIRFCPLDIEFEIYDQNRRKVATHFEAC